MTDIYQAPSSALTESAALEGFGSLQRGIAGEYQFSIREIIRESWEKTSGAKGTVWLATLLYVLVIMPLSIGIPFVLGVLGLSMTPVPGESLNLIAIVASLLSQIVIMAITLPLGAGLFMIGLKLASSAPVSGTEVFAYFNKTMSLLGTVVLMYIMIALGLLLLIIPGIYLIFAYYMAIPLVVEKGLGPWQALEASRKAVSKRWFRFVGLGLVFMLLMMVASIPLGIGLIWVIPMVLIAYGIAYRNMFGFEGLV